VKTVKLCTLFLALPTVWSATLSHDYNLTSSLNDLVGSVALVSDGGSVTGAGYTFAAQQGLNLSNALLNSGDYSILIDFSFSTLSGFRKILDFKNQASDDGLYNFEYSPELLQLRHWTYRCFHSGHAGSPGLNARCRHQRGDRLCQRRIRD